MKTIHLGKMGIEVNRGNNNCIPLSGVGYVVIPKNANTAEYVQRCYRNHSVSISGGYDSTYMHGVKITEDALNKIKFPADNSGLGSAVVWIRDSFTNRAIVIGTLKTAGESNLVQGDQQRIVQETARSVVEIFLDALNNTVNISAMGDENTPATINLKTSSRTDEGDAINIISKDLISINSRSVDIDVIEKGAFTINDGDKELIRISGDKEKLHIIDHFGNEAIFNEENVKILTTKFNVGEGKEQMVLGNTLVDLLSQLIDAITNMTVLTHVGQSGTPVNSATFSAIKERLNEILSELSNTD